MKLLNYSNEISHNKKKKKEYSDICKNGNQQMQKLKKLFLESESIL